MDKKCSEVKKPLATNAWVTRGSGFNSCTSPTNNCWYDGYVYGIDYHYVYLLWTIFLGASIEYNIYKNNDKSEDTQR